MRYIVILVISLLICSCGSEKKVKDDGHLTVAVSIEPQRWLLNQLAGDRVEVRCMMDKNADAENFDPTVSTLRDIESSDAYLCIGNNLFESTTLGRLSDSGPAIFDISEGIELLTGTHGDCHNHAHHHNHGDVDPHTWQSVKNMKIMAQNAARALIQLDPAGKSFYAARLDSLTSQLDTLHRQIADKLQGAQGRSFAVWHPSLSYFAHDYGLKQISLGSESKESSPAALARTLELAKSSGVAVMILQDGDDEARSAEMAQQLGTRTAKVNIYSYHWPATMLSLATAFEQ